MLNNVIHVIMEDMKIINYICDNCNEIVASKRKRCKEIEETHLLPMGYQEWCIGCVDKFENNK